MDDGLPYVQGVGGLASRLIVPRRSRRQGLRAGLRPVLASALRAALTAALRRGGFDSGNPAPRPLKRRRTVLVAPSSVWPQPLYEVANHG
jgi:hypothetical protein